MKTGYLRRDDSFHWYAIPTDEVWEFDALMDKISLAPEDSDEWYEATNVLEDLFGQDRIGNPCEVKVIIDE